jgi:nucleoside 2-deoxyribosyltransferase
MSAIYVAGPLGFSEAGRSFYYGSMLPHLRGAGFEIFDPWKLTEAVKIDFVKRLPYGPAKRYAWERLNFEIASNNVVALNQCDGVVAVLDGSDVDSGTAAEIGYAFAKNKPIVGYRGDFRLSGDNEGSTINLQVEFFVSKSGGSVVSTFSEISEALRVALKRQAEMT